MRHLLVQLLMFLGCAGIPALAVGQTEPDPGAEPEQQTVPSLRPIIEPAQKEGDEVRLQGTAPPGVRVVARLGAQTFETTADDYGRWWLKFTPGGAREVIVVIGDFRSTVSLPRTAVAVEVTVEDATGPQVAIAGRAPDHIVISMLSGNQTVARAQPTSTQWRIEAEVPDGVPSVAIVATEADGTEVMRREVALDWPRHELTVAYPAEGRIATPFGVHGKTTPGATVRVRHGETTVETVADEEGTYRVSVPPPKRGLVELSVEAGPGTDRSVRRTIRLDVVNTLEAPVGRIVLGSSIGTVLGLGLGAGFGYWMADLLYTCTADCFVTRETVQISSAIYGATWGAASIGPTAMHMLAHAGGYNGSYATAAGISAATTLLVWTFGAYILAVVQPPDNLALYSAIIAGTGGVAATALSAWGYTIRGDQTRRKLQRSSIRIRPAGFGIAGSW